MAEMGYLIPFPSGGFRGGLVENQDFLQLPVITRQLMTPIVSFEAIYETRIRPPALSSRVVSGEA